MDAHVVVRRHVFAGEHRWPDEPIAEHALFTALLHCHAEGPAGPDGEAWGLQGPGGLGQGLGPLRHGGFEADGCEQRAEEDLKRTEWTYNR